MRRDQIMRRLFDNPVFGNHAQLVLGWSDEQLAIADRHPSRSCPAASPPMVIAVALSRVGRDAQSR